MVKKAVIPAAGHGTRLLPLTRSQPKEMVACGRAPVVGYVLEELRAAGIEDVLLISRSGKSILEDFVFDEWPGAFVLRQAEQKGLGHAVSLAERWVGSDSFVVALGDTIVTHTGPISPLQRLIRQRPEGASSMVLVREVPPERMALYGMVAPLGEARIGEPFSLQGIVEKPQPGTAPSNLAIAGRYVFSPAIFAALADTSPRVENEIQLTDAMTLLCTRPGGMYATSLLPGERRFDIGGMNSYFEAFAALSAADSGKGEPCGRSS